MRPLAIILLRVDLEYPQHDRTFYWATVSQRVRRGMQPQLPAHVGFSLFPVSPAATLPVLPGSFSQIKDLHPTHCLKVRFLENLHQCTCDIGMRAVRVTQPPPPESPRRI